MPLPKDDLEFGPVVDGLTTISPDLEFGPVLDTNPAARGGLNRWLVDPVARSWESGMQALDVLKLGTGQMSPEDFARDVTARDWNTLAHPRHPDDQASFDKIANTEGWDQVVQVLLNPNVWAQAATESATAMGVSTATGLAGGAAGGAAVSGPAAPVGALAGGVLGTFAGSSAFEYAQSILDAVRSSGGVVDQNTLMRAVQDPEIMAKARDIALKRGIAVGAFDAISFGLAGKAAKPIEKMLGENVGGKLAGIAAEGTQGAVTGAGGEATAQVASGQEINPGAIALEGIAEVPGVGLDVAAKTVTGGLKPDVKADAGADLEFGEVLPLGTFEQPANVQQVDPTTFVPPAPVAPAPMTPVAATSVEPVTVTPTITPPPEAAVSPPAAATPTPAPVQQAAPVSTDTDPGPVAPVTPVNSQSSQVAPSESQAQPSAPQVEPSSTPTPTPAAPAPAQNVAQTPEPIPAKVAAPPQTVQPTGPVNTLNPPEAPRAAPNQRSTVLRVGNALRVIENGLTGTAAAKKRARETIHNVRTQTRFEEDETPEQYRIGDRVSVDGGKYSGSKSYTILGVKHVPGASTQPTVLTVMDRSGNLSRINADQVSLHEPIAQDDPGPPIKPWWHGSAEPNKQGIAPGDKIVTATGERGTVAGVWKSKEETISRKTGFKSKPVNVAYVPEGAKEGTYRTAGVDSVAKDTSAASVPKAPDAPTSGDNTTQDGAKPSPVLAPVPQPASKTASTVELAPAAEETPARQFSDTAEGDTDAAQEAGTRDSVTDTSLDDEELRDDRRPRGTLAPQTEDVSMTNRRSIYEEAYRAAGLDPDEGVLLPPREKINVLKKVLMDTFGFLAVRVTGDLKDGANQMLDAYRNVRFMMHALGLPIKAVSLDGTLSINLERDLHRYFGVYRLGDRSIGLPGRSNSFAHEWAHALDHFLADRLRQVPDMLSRFTRSDGLDPTVSIENAFINLLHTLFYDDAGLAARTLILEQDAAKTDKNGQPTQGALVAQKQLKNLKAGATRLRLPESEYRQRSEDYDPNSPYWTSIHEMLARAFEAYVAARVEALGGSNEFITKGEAAYLSDADRRLDLTFPKGIERDKIFAAFDDVIHHIRNLGILGTGPAAPKPADMDIIDPQFWNKVVLSQGNQTLFNSVKAEAIAVRNAAQSAINDPAGAAKNVVSTIAMNAGLNTSAWTPRKVGRAVMDYTRLLVFTMRGALRPRIKRNKGRGSLFLQEVFDRFITVNGDGRWHGTTYEDERQQEGSKLIIKIENALRANGFNNLKLSTVDNDTVRELLFGEKVPGARAELVKVAAAMRRVMEDAHSAMQKAGISIGYVTEKGYLPRVINTTKVQTSPGGFEKAATKLYRIVFDNIVGAKDFEPRDALGLSREVNFRLGDTNGRSRFATEDGALRAAMKAVSKAADALNNATTNKRPQGEIDAAKQELKAALADQKKAMDDLLSVLRDPFAEVSAIDWRTRVQIGDSFTYDSHGPAANFTNNRTLPPEADTIMAEWYNTDAINLTASYAQQTAARVAYHERAGLASGAKRIQDVIARRDVQNRMNATPASKAKYEVGKDVRDMSEAARLAIIKDFANTKTDNIIEMLLIEAERSDAFAEDVTTMREAVQSITGRGDRAPFTATMNRLSGLLFAYTYLKLLPRAAITSITEPVSVLLRTGDMKAMFNTFAAYLSELNQSAKSVEERQAIARAIGLTTSPLYDTILMSRMGMDYGQLTSGNVMLARFFNANFLTAITNAQRRSVMAGGFTWMRDMATSHGSTDSVHKKMIEAEFRELGVRDEDMASFVNWLVQSKNAPDLDALNSKAGKVFEHAIHRLTGQIIQDPRRGDKPMLASTPLGRTIYALTAYLYSFFSNVHAATVERFKRNYTIARGEGLSKGEALYEAGLPAATSFVGGFAFLFAGQFLTSVVRESLLNGEQWEKHKDDDDLFQWLFALSVSRTGIWGPADVALNSVTGLKYERDLINIMNGPGLSSIFSDLQNIAGLWTTNSPNTNTAERNAAKGLYRLLIAPALSGVLSAMQTAGPLGDALRYSGMIGLTSNAAASKFADMLAGAPQRLKKGDEGYVP